jgi:hypothetical protein
MLARDFLVGVAVCVRDLVGVPGIETWLRLSRLARKITGFISQKNNWRHRVFDQKNNWHRRPEK